MVSTFSRASIGIAAALLSCGLVLTSQAKDFIKEERPQQRGYSVAVITEGGRTVWLAGQTATVDDAGKSLAGDFDGQAGNCSSSSVPRLRRRAASSATWCR